jgi:hypothetical protein
VAGIGIDLAETGAFQHLDSSAIEGAARRWLSPSERAWCAVQPSFRQALVTVLSCKESVFKATESSEAFSDVPIALCGVWPQGWAESRTGSASVTLWWEARPGQILTVAATGVDEIARRLIRRILGGLPT